MNKFINDYPGVKDRFKSFIKKEFRINPYNREQDELSFAYFLFFLKNNLLCSTINYPDKNALKWKNKLICRKTSALLYEKDNFLDYYLARIAVYRKASSILENILNRGKND